MLLDKILVQAEADGHTFIAYYDDPTEPDYVGKEPLDAKEALEACDMMNLTIHDANGKKLAWLLIVNEVDQDPEEQIADYAITDWMRKHWAAEIDY